MEIGDNSGTVGVAIGLALFGLAYNQLVTWTKRRGYDEGYMSLIVTGGVAITLLGVAILDASAAALAFFAFVLTGLPMVAGSVWRHVRARERSQNAIRREVLDR